MLGHQRKAESRHQKRTGDNILHRQALAENGERGREPEENRAIGRQCDHKSHIERAKSNALQQLAAERQQQHQLKVEPQHGLQIEMPHWNEN